MGGELPSFYDFGRFRLDATQHVLLRDGVVIPVAPKSFETLFVLVRNHGRVVEKDDLLKSVWADTFVEEATLAQNIFTVRKILGSSEGDEYQYIKTIPKRGYRFVASVTEIPDQDSYSEVEQVDTAPQRESKTVTSDMAIRSLAVLPMINVSADPNAEYLSDGITESVVNILSLLPELHVKACSTVASFKGREVDPQEVGRELGVGAVMWGRVLPLDENVIIRIELVDVASGWQLWGEQYNEKLSNIFRVQEEIAKHISENLRLKLTGVHWAQLVKAHTDKPEAIRLYLKGRYFLNKRTEDGYQKAIESFENAIETDPDYPLAYSGLADSYIFFDFYGLKPPWETVPKARAAADKALEIDDQLAEAHTSAAAIKLVYDRNPEGALKQFKQAIKLNPKYAHAHNGYARCLMELGRIEESLAKFRTALELEPFDLEINQHLGWYYLFTRQCDQAIEQLMKTLEMGPNFYRARLLLGMAYGQKGLFSEAIAEFHRADELENTRVLSGFLGYAYAMAGRKKEAMTLLADTLEEARRSYVPPYSIALMYAGLGKRDKALAWLEKACVEHSHWRGWLKLTPELDLLRSEVGVSDLLDRFGVPGN